MKAVKLLQTAANLVAHDREKSHGPKLKNHQNIAALWNAYLGIRRNPSEPLSPQDVATMMALLKIARMELGNTNLDNAVDGAGYLAIRGELDAG